MASNVRFIDALKVGQFKGNKGDQGDTGPTGSGFPFTGSARITGSLDLTGSLDVDGNITSSGNILLKGNSQALQGFDSFGGTTVPLITSTLPLGAIFGDYALEGVNLNSKENFNIQTSGSSGALSNKVFFNKRGGLTNALVIDTERGHITASGNISASGDIFARNISSSGHFSSSGDLEIRNLTASGNISASGDIIGNGISGSKINVGTGQILTAKSTGFSGTSFLPLLNVDDIQLKVGNKDGAVVTALEGQQITLTTSASLNLITFSATGTGITTTFDTVTGNMTASGNISASNIIISNITASSNISASGDIFARNISSSGHFSSSGDLEIRNITASGNISSSVALISDTITTSGNIIGGDRITATGRIIGSSTILGNGIISTSYISASGLIQAGEALLLKNEGDNGFVIISGSDSADDARNSQIKFHRSLEFRSSGGNTDEILTLGLNGNVGIGKHNANEKLEVSGSISSSGDLSLQGNITSSGNINASGTGSFSDGRFTGNVGIGVTNPDLKLHIEHSNNDNGLLLEHTNQSNDYQYLLNIRQNEGLIFQRWDNGSFSTNVMTLDYSGNVGIGTTSPTKKLQVAGNISSSGAINTLSHITASGNISASGFISASSFSGEGTGLTGVILGTGVANFVPQFSNANTIQTASQFCMGSNSVQFGTSLTDDTARCFLVKAQCYPAFRAQNEDNAYAFGLRPGGAFAFTNVNGNQRPFQIGCNACSNAFFIGGGNDGRNISFATHGTCGNVGIGWTNNSTVPARFTLMGHSTTDIIRVYDSSSAANQLMTFDYQGNLGIGVTSPDQKLHVDGNLKLGSGFRIFNNDGNYWQRIRTEDAVPDSTNAFNFETRNGSGDFVPHVTIQNSGNVGIGTTTASALLHISGSTSNNRFLQIGNDSQAYLVVTGSNGNIGIGTTSPSTLLQLSGSGGNTSGLSFINGSGEFLRQYFSNENADSDFVITYDGTGGAEITLQHDGDLILNGSNDDNVGIGTTSPSEKLSVTGSGRVTRIESSNDSVPLVVENSGGGHARVGFKGTNSTSDYHVSAGAIGNNFVVRTDDTERIRITSDGNLGIGTTSAPQLLTVEGNISASGGITSSGIIISETITSGATGSFGAEGTNGTVVLTDTSAESRVTALNNHLVLRTQRDADDIKFQGGDSTTNYAIIEGDTGNFGIGTTSPSEKLSVSGNITATNITASGTINIAQYIKHIGDTNSAFGFSSTDNFEIRTAGSSRLTVNSSGRVGIGTTSPGCTLDICGISRVDELDHSQYKLSTNDSIAFTSQPKTYAASPNAYLYHDVLGFDYSYTRTQETSSNGTDFGARDLQKKLFSQKQDQAVTVIESGDVAVRFTFTNVSFILPQFVNFAFTFVSGDIDKQLLVETGDGSSYTTRHTSSASSGVKTISAFIDSYGSDTHMRITITKADPTSTQEIKMSSLKLLTARAGDQGQGMEFQYPYTYDEDRNIGIGFTQGTPSEDDTRLGIKGSGSDATSNAILAKNSSNTTIFTARNDGLVSVGSNFVVSGSQIDFTNVPTSDPGIAGRLFRDGTDLKISVG